MICLDSSLWIEYFVNGPRAADVQKALHEPEHIAVPSVCLVEVGRYMVRTFGEEPGSIARQAMERSQQVALEGAIAGAAVAVGLKHKLALADSIIYATAQVMGATLWTMDNDFEGLPNVKYLSKKK